MYSSSLKKYEDEKEFFTFPICAFNTSVENMHFGFCYIFMTFFFLYIIKIHYSLIFVAASNVLSY